MDVVVATDTVLDKAVVERVDEGDEDEDEDEDEGSDVCIQLEDWVVSSSDHVEVDVLVRVVEAGVGEFEVVVGPEPNDHSPRKVPSWSGEAKCSKNPLDRSNSPAPHPMHCAAQ
jgi:hypothetical protein